MSRFGTAGCAACSREYILRRFGSFFLSIRSFVDFRVRNHTERPAPRIRLTNAPPLPIKRDCRIIVAPDAPAKLRAASPQTQTSISATACSSSAIDKNGNFAPEFAAVIAQKIFAAARIFDYRTSVSTDDFAEFSARHFVHQSSLRSLFRLSARHLCFCELASGRRFDILFLSFLIVIVTVTSSIFRARLFPNRSARQSPAKFPAKAAFRSLSFLFFFRLLDFFRFFQAHQDDK